MKTSEILTLVLGLSVIAISIFSLGIEKTNQNVPEEELIIGTWIAKDSPSVKMVFTKDGLQKDYVNDNLEDTYRWSINKEQTPSGLTIPELVLKNIQDPNDVYKYEIDTLTQERLILIYNTGIGLSRSVFFRQ